MTPNYDVIDKVPAVFVAATRLPTKFGEFLLHGFASGEREHLALTMGDVRSAASVLARIHSECLTGDALFSLRCDCGKQLEAAMAAIAQEGCGVVLYLRQEGRGIGLLNKLRAYALQDTGLDTFDANTALGLPADARDYQVCKSILEHLGVSRLRLMTNNPRKVEALNELGIPVVERVPHLVGACSSNRSYLETKAARFGHLLTL